jgi:CubicO group peptidase (beta-lactamase class C family)
MAVLLPAFHPIATAAPESLADVVREAEQTVLALAEEEELVGTGFAIYYQGQLITRAFGSSSADGQSAFSPDTPTALHELAQPFTALAVMQLAGKGLIDLDQPISHWFPDFRPWSAQYAGPGPTVRQLLSHHSGLPAYFAPGSGREGHGLDTEQFGWQALVNNSGTMTFVAEPGSVYEYSYLAYSLLGALVETVSGLDFQAYIGTNILEPLGMGNTSLAADPDTVEGVSPAFVDGALVPHRKFRDIPAAGLISSLADMGSFMAGMLHNDKLLDAASRQQMFAVQNAMVPQDGNFEIGLGWFVSPVTGGTFRNGETVSHASTDGVARSYLLLDPSRDVGVLLATNSRLSSVKLRDTTDRIMELLLQQDSGYRPEPWQPHDTIDAVAAENGQIAGIYSGPGGLFRISATRKGLELDVPYLPFLGVTLLPREDGFYGVDIRLLGFLNIGRFSQVRLLSDSLEGKVSELDGRKLINWYWRGITAVTLTGLPVSFATEATSGWGDRTGDYRSDTSGGNYRLEYDDENGIFTFGIHRRGFRLFQEPPDIYCPVSPLVLETCGKGLVGNGTRNLLRILEDGRILSAYGEIFTAAE